LEDRLHAQEAKTREAMARDKQRLAMIQAQQRSLEKKARDLRRYQVGMLADSCGLLVVDDAILRPLFTMLHGMTSTPNPVALLEALLKDVSGQPGRSVDGLATAAQCVSADTKAKEEY
jgi:hypothetical protein